LQKLSLLDNQLSKIPREIGKLKELQELWLNDNKIKELSKEITQLRNLQKLDLSNNQLSELPKKITQLKNLQYLNLSNNQLSELPKRIIDLENLEIKWREDYSSEGIILEGNPLESPPIEIVKKGREAVIEYFKSLEGEKQVLNEVKVLLVGEGGAGKTSLVKRLLGKKFDKEESKTEGINIEKWGVNEGGKKIKVHLWDFGGQEIMHDTHQFFLSKCSLYVLVLDGRREEKPEYWLKHIESFGGNSPILVVLNKIDENRFDVNRGFLQEKYPSIKGFYPVSCKTNKGIKTFKESLKRALNDVEIIRTMWAKSWFNVKTQLENMEDDFISYKKYQEICNKENITEKSAQDTLADFLNDLGVILHFREFGLEDKLVLRPRWLTGAVYRVINSEKLAKCNGVLRLDSLVDILKESDYSYPQDKHRFIIDLMKKFELCYEMGENKVLIPDLLKVQEPEFGFEFDSSLKFVMEYDFMPRSVMPRFIVKMHKDIKNRSQWRTGVVLKDEDIHSTAVIKSDDEAKKIFIYVNGEQKRDYFSVVRKTFLDINNSFEKIDVKEMVPCNCPLCKDSKNPHFYDYKSLIKFYLKNRRETLCSLSADYVSIEKLLNGVETDVERIPKKYEVTPEGDVINKKVKTRILFLSANPTSYSRIRLDEEVRRIQTDLKSAKERDNLELKQESAVTTDTLMQSILDESPRIVHFSGHGEQQGIILENEIGEPKMVSMEALAALFKLFKDSVECVVLNSCYSKNQAKAIKLHIPYVVGMNTAVPDKAAIAFSKGFYKALGAGKDIPFAFKLGVAAIKLEGVKGADIPELL